MHRRSSAGVGLPGTLDNGTFDAPGTGPSPFGQLSGVVQGTSTSVSLSVSGSVTGTDTGGSFTLQVPLVLGLAQPGGTPCQEQVAVTLVGPVAPGPGSTVRGTLATTAPVALMGSCGSLLAAAGPSSAPSPTLLISLPVTVYGAGAVGQPAVQRVFPPDGPAGAYTVVWVLGAATAQPTGVALGTTKVLWRAFGPRLVALLAPPGPASPADVRVTTAGGTSAVNPADVFTRT